MKTRHDLQSCVVSARGGVRPRRGTVTTNGPGKTTKFTSTLVNTCWPPRMMALRRQLPPRQARRRAIRKAKCQIWPPCGDIQQSRPVPATPNASSPHSMWSSALALQAPSCEHDAIPPTTIASSISVSTAAGKKGVGACAESWRCGSKYGQGLCESVHSALRFAISKSVVHDSIEGDK